MAVNAAVTPIGLFRQAGDLFLIMTSASAIDSHTTQANLRQICMRPEFR